MPASRKSARRPSTFTLNPRDGFDVEPEVIVFAPPEPVDPAVAVAGQMLARAVARLPDHTLAIGAPGSVAIVHTPTAEWTEVARDAWKILAHGGDEPKVENCRWWDRSTAWIAFVRAEEDGIPASATPRDGGEDLAEALWRGKAAGGFSPEPDELLPRDLVQAADFRLEMGLPTPPDVTGAAETVSNTTATLELTAAEAAAATPRLLRLARRPDQTADAYLAKVRRLLVMEEKAEAPTPPARTPRNEPTLDRLHGMTEATDWGRGVADDLREFVAGRLPWSEVNGHACLLSGPPGCGKSLFARALAATCGVPLVTGSYGQWHSSGNSHQGDLLKAMRNTFAEAKRLAPSILFIDEIDSFPNRANIVHAWADWEIQVVNALLELIDGGAGREGVVVVAACNQPHLLDPALVRSGRLDRHLRIGLPDREGLERILREHLGPDIPDAPLSGVALSLAGSTGADVERIVRATRARARKAGRAMLLDDLVVEAGGDDQRTPADLWRVAVHEAGHALALCEHLPGTLRAVTLRSSGERGGGTTAVHLGGTVLAADVCRSLICRLAGRAAEEVVFGLPSSGAGGGPDSDLAHASLAAAEAASAMGFAADRSLVWRGVPTAATLPRMLEKFPALAAEVERALGEAYGKALELVSARKDDVLAVAIALLARGAMDEAEVLAILNDGLGGDVS